MTNHINDCPCHCQYCDTIAERDVMSDHHMEKCHKFPVPCPNACGRDKIPQDEVDSHKKECPLEVIYCEYYDMGCKTMLVRDKMTAHNRDETARHLQCIHRFIKQLQKGSNNLQSHSTEAAAEAITKLHHNEELEPLPKYHKLQQGVMTKFKIGIRENYHKIERNIVFMLVSAVVLAFAILIAHYDREYALVIEQLHNLSTTDDINQLRNDKLINLLQENLKLQNSKLEQVSKAVIEADTHVEASKDFLITLIYHIIIAMDSSTITNAQFPKFK